MNTELSPAPCLAPQPAAIALRPRASIITVNWNEKHRLIDYLPSLWATRGDFELIISDNGSNDGGVEYIEAHYPQTRIVKNGKNLGFAAANNRAAKHARADILVFLNCDTTVEPDWLTELLKPFADPVVGLATSRIVLMRDPATLNTCGNDVHLSGLTLCRGMGQPRDRFPHDDDVLAVSGAAFAIRREVFEAVGGFNEDYFTYMEETALSLEARLRGWRCVYTAASIVRHDYVLKFGPRKIFYQERNRAIMLLQVFRWRTLLALLPALVAAECLTWGFVLFRDRPNWKNKLKAYRELWLHWRDICAKRRLNQAQRRVPDRTLLKQMGYKLDFGQVARGLLARIASLVCDPVFWLLRQVVLAVVWW